MIKTFEATSPEELDAYCNEFEQKFQVFATQTHVLRNEGMKTLYIAVLFYKKPEKKYEGIEL